MPIIKSLREVVNSVGVEKGMTEKQIRIICAAIEIFCEKGYEAATTHEIAQKANVAEGTIFRHYKTKKDLLAAIPECLTETSLSQILIDDINEILNDNYEKFEDFLRRIILNRKDFISENMSILKAVLQEAPFHPDLRNKIMDIVFSPVMNQIDKAIDRFKEQGQIVDMPSNSIAKLIFSSVFGYFFTRYIAKLDLNWDEKEETVYLIRFIMNGISKTNTTTNNMTLS